mmetsp:Transcript_25324/g.31539  ORF Transcript_25324/g.31539 Transcript_25324/m.31539 type:complete len:549 (+) Transcript_25324:1-1647(+)
MDETFSAPDAVRQALMDHAGVHEALIGSLKSQETERSIKSDQINLLTRLTRGAQQGSGNSKNACIFASTKENNRVVFQQYLVTISRFSRSTSTMVRVVSDPKVLAMGEDKEGINRAIACLEGYNKDITKIGQDIEKYENRHSDLQQEHAALSKKKKDLGDQIQSLKQLEQRIQSQQDKINQLESQMSGDIDEEKEQITLRLQKTIESHFKTIEAAQQIQNQLMEQEVRQTARHLSFNILHATEKAAKAALDEARRKNQDLEEEVKMAKVEFKRLKEKARVQKEKAKEAANVEEDNDLRTALNNLPDIKEQIEDMINEHNSEADMISENPAVMEKYEKNLQEIESQERQLQKLLDTGRQKNEKMDLISSAWEKRVINCIQKLNDTFSTYMKQMSCGGKVELFKGNGSFKDYAVHIKVKFREHSDYQILNGKVHSGGERSVSTILYLMSLQDLMFSPFRVVDEINQGMDERNERLVFSRIVRNCCGPRRPQYFLITPKLLQGLVAMDNDDVTVHIILNGPWNLPDPSMWLDVVRKVRTEAEKRKKRQRIA